MIFHNSGVEEMARHEGHRVLADLVGAYLLGDSAGARSRDRWQLTLMGFATAAAGIYVTYRFYDRRLGQLVDHHLVEHGRNGRAASPWGWTPERSVSAEG